MTNFQPADPDFESRVRASFAAQKFMSTLGAGITRVAPGEVTIEMPYSEDLTQQDGFIHAGVTTGDSGFGVRVCGVYADAGGCTGALGRIQGQPALTGRRGKIYCPCGSS